MQLDAHQNKAIRDETTLKADANHQAFEVYETARKQAASNGNIKEWQRLDRAVTTLHKFHPEYSQEVML